MSVCIGCGLEVNQGILEVNVCGDPVVPNTTVGGLQCDENTEGGCLKVVLNDSHAGCGLSAASGALFVDPCLNGGILCGDTADDPEDQCIYVNVQGQGNALCVPLETTAMVTATNCGFGGNTGSPNCNGLVRTCDGLWAPPKLRSINFSCGQDSRGPGTIADIRRPLGAQVNDVDASLDPFASHDGDFVFGTANGRGIIVNAFNADPCNPMDAMSWTAFNVGYTVNAGELWRWALWERICTNVFPPADNITRNDPLNSATGCNGTTWKLQAIQYIDRRNENTAAFETVQINDNSTWRFGTGGCEGNRTGLGNDGLPAAWRMEAMITFQRLQPANSTAAANNPIIFANFQYRNMGHSYHLQTTQNCSFRSTA